MRSDVYARGSSRCSPQPCARHRWPIGAGKAEPLTSPACLGAKHGRHGEAASCRAHDWPVDERDPEAEAAGIGQCHPNAVDRDALLKELFPGGMPAREEVIRAVTSWLETAEQLARMR